MSSLQGTIVKTPDGMDDAFDITVGGIRARGPQLNQALKCRTKGD
ncbi:hypothetical protein YDYSG_61710 [Paenibacillus tyrfis]|nr:hypothetical protein [Paenibacillus tyrfis]GLI10138.1 hypothetical protein YDYSG_61710 [Paenibacillus tyrfis]